MRENGKGKMMREKGKEVGRAARFFLSSPLSLPEVGEKSTQQHSGAPGEARESVFVLRERARARALLARCARFFSLSILSISLLYLDRLDQLARDPFQLPLAQLGRV